MTTIKVIKYHSDEGKLFYKVTNNGWCAAVFNADEEEKAIECAKVIEERFRNPIPPPETIFEVNID
jgi:hypothetical protein